MHSGISQILYERNDLDAALRHVQLSRDLGPAAGFPQNEYRWRVALADSVPRAIASAVSDWRRSNGATRLIWRAGDSIVVNPIRFHDDHPAAMPSPAKSRP